MANDAPKQIDTTDANEAPKPAGTAPQPGAAFLRDLKEINGPTHQAASDTKEIKPIGVPQPSQSSTEAAPGEVPKDVNGAKHARATTPDISDRASDGKVGNGSAVIFDALELWNDLKSLNNIDSTKTGKDVGKLINDVGKLTTEVSHMLSGFSIGGVDQPGHQAAKPEGKHKEQPEGQPDGKHKGHESKHEDQPEGKTGDKHGDKHADKPKKVRLENPKWDEKDPVPHFKQVEGEKGDGLEGLSRSGRPTIALDKVEIQRPGKEPHVLQSSVLQLVENQWHVDSKQSPESLAKSLEAAKESAEKFKDKDFEKATDKFIEAVNKNPPSPQDVEAARTAFAIEAARHTTIIDLRTHDDPNLSKKPECICA